MITKKEHAVRLWDECFGDSEKFTEFYFNNIYKDEYTYIYVEKNKPICHLQTIPYKIHINGKDFMAHYISGACTTQDERGKGHMTRMLLSVLHDRKDKDDVYSFLIPANDGLFNFYEKNFGYKPFFFQQKTDSLSDIKYFLPNKLKQTSDLSSIIIEGEKQREFSLVKHDHWQIKNIIKEYNTFDNYDIITIKDNKKLYHGVAFIEFDDEGIIIKDIFSSACVYDYLIDDIMKKYPDRKIIITSPVKSASDNKIIKKGMLKCLDKDNNDAINALNDNIGFMSLMHE